MTPSILCHPILFENGVKCMQKGRAGAGKESKTIDADRKKCSSGVLLQRLLVSVFYNHETMTSKFGSISSNSSKGSGFA